MINHNIKLEQGEDYPPSSAEKIKDEETILEQKKALPKTEELDGLLQKAEKVAETSSFSETEVDKMIEKHRQTFARLQNIELVKEQRLRRTENYNPSENLNSFDYERLVQEKIIGSSYVQRLKKLDSVITELESLKYPPADTEVELEKLIQTRNSIREDLESQIKQRQDDLSERREDIRNKIIVHYAKRVEELKEIIREIKADPQVAERLQKIAEEKQKDFETKIAQERKRLLAEVARLSQSIMDRHRNAFKKLIEITGNENINQELLAILKENKEKQQSFFNQIRNYLIKSIIEGRGETQLKNPKEIVPWVVYPTSLPYIDTINALSSQEIVRALKAAAKTEDKQAKSLLERYSRILDENQAFRKLIGRKWIMDKKTGEKKMTRFWSAFKTREENDKKGITETRRKEQEKIARREAESRQAEAEIIKKGGIIVEVPIIKIINGRQQVVAKEKGVVYLEKITSKKGNKCWKVIETFGAADCLEIGRVSPLNMKAFPNWLRQSARVQYRKHGEDFVEPLVYEEGK